MQELAALKETCINHAESEARCRIDVCMAQQQMALPPLLSPEERPPSVEPDGNASMQVAQTMQLAVSAISASHAIPPEDVAEVHAEAAERDKKRISHCQNVIATVFKKMVRACCSLLEHCASALRVRLHRAPHAHIDCADAGLLFVF